MNNRGDLAKLLREEPTLEPAVLGFGEGRDVDAGFSADEDGGDAQEEEVGQRKLDACEAARILEVVEANDNIGFTRRGDGEPPEGTREADVIERARVHPAYFLGCSCVGPVLKSWEGQVNMSGEEDQRLVDLLTPFNECEREIALECLKAVVSGPFFVTWWIPKDQPDFNVADKLFHPSRRFLTTRLNFERVGHKDWSKVRKVMGISREELKTIIQHWGDLSGMPKHFIGSRPEAKISRESSIRLGVNNAMLNLLYYPHGCDDVWGSYLTVSKEELSLIFDRWRDSQLKQ